MLQDRTKFLERIRKSAPELPDHIKQQRLRDRGQLGRKTDVLGSARGQQPPPARPLQHQQQDDLALVRNMKRDQDVLLQKRGRSRSQARSLPDNGVVAEGSEAAAIRKMKQEQQLLLLRSAKQSKRIASKQSCANPVKLQETVVDY